MLRVGGIVMLLASVCIAGLLLLRIREERYAGPIEYVNADGATFELVENPEPIIEAFGLRPLPPTLPSDLEARFRAIKSREWIGLQLRFPEPLPAHVAKHAPVELRHAFLDLPFVGPVAGRTRLKVGSGEWKTSPWPFWGSIAGIAAAPGLIWLLATLPVLLFGRRCEGRGREIGS
jgi:hypothetical protein